LVLGGGSAGFLAAMTLKRRLPELAVTVVRSRDLGVIGVGESTTVAVPRHLHGYLDFDPGEFHRRAQPAWKVGGRLLVGPPPCAWPAAPRSAPTCTSTAPASARCSWARPWVSRSSVTRPRCSATAPSPRPGRAPTRPSTPTRPPRRWVPAGAGRSTTPTASC